MRARSLWKVGKRLWTGQELPKAFFFVDRPLVVLHSDDWGRIGVRDRDGYEELRGRGVQLGQNPYDFYTLETADDLSALMELLTRHKDSVNRPPSVVMNFMLANLDFARMQTRDFREICLLFLSNGLPGRWKRPKLFDTYREGIARGVFYPALHGLTHFCRMAAEQALLNDGEKRELLRTLWQADTPFIYWRMPWIGYEYHNPEKPNAGFLPLETQQILIHKAAEEFRRFFSISPVSACAPGYRCNSATQEAWAQNGLLVVQNGSGTPLPPHLGASDLLNLYRTIDLEPASRELSVEKYLQLAVNSLSRGIPAVISVHSINFHSTLKDFRSPTLRILDELLSAIERQFPDLLYVNDEDMYRIATEGKLQTAHGTLTVRVKQQQSAMSVGRA